MGVTGHVTDADVRLLEVEKLVNSHTLHGSESLCKLLRYLADQAVKHPGSALKEYQIATEVFGRPSDFDPHLDSLVRVQAGRLRAKLADYYASEGGEDPIVVELPKGTYTLAFHQATHAEKAPLREVSEAELGSRVSQSRRNSFVIAALSVLLVVALGVIVALYSRERSTGSPAAEQPVPSAIQVFWRPFVTSPEVPWVIFSNGAFVGRAETGLRYFNPAKDSKQAIDDHYTGVGEVLAIYDLDHVFRQLHREIRVKRGSLFTLDDAQNNNLIFVGSPAENLTLLDIPSTHEFVFQRLTTGPRKGDLAVMNVHPQPGEDKNFLATPPSSPLAEDYAIIALVPAMNPARSLLILAGATTIGTQAAAEYVCRPESLERLLLRLSVSENGEMSPFEAVLRIKVTRGVPIESELVALRKVSR